MRVHDTSHFSARIDNNSYCFATGQEAIAPKCIIKINCFPYAIILTTCLDFKDSLEIVDVELRSLGFYCCLQSYKVGLVIILKILMREIN